MIDAMTSDDYKHDLRSANVARQKEWDAFDQLTLAYRGNELAGEVGEACNVIKKLERERLGIAGSRDTIAHLAEELADVIICTDLIAMQAGIDLDAAVVAKFNASSEKVGLKTRLRAASVKAGEVVANQSDGGEPGDNTNSRDGASERPVSGLPATAQMGSPAVTAGETAPNSTPPAPHELYPDGEAPWPEDEQFEERAKACRSRCGKYGYVCDGSEDAEFEYEGQCAECEYDAALALGERYAKPPRTDEVALADVAAERKRQREVEGWTAEHDDGHDNGELARAAAAYALAGATSDFHRNARSQNEKLLREYENYTFSQFRQIWPWDWNWWKPKDRRRDLVRAGALILAEIERIDRRALLGKSKTECR